VIVGGARLFDSLHRLAGGRSHCYLHTPTRQYAGGKSRLMYEANPITLLAERVGGVATD